jgi:Nuclease-related domain
MNLAVSVHGVPHEEKETSSPFRGSASSAAGTSVREGRERLFDDKVMGYFFAVLVTWVLAIWQWFYWWTGSKPSPGFATVLASIVTVYCAYRIWRIRPEFRNLNLGEKGERRVSEVLRTLRHRDYVTFDDLLLEGVNVDHVVVGPGGVFAVETKAFWIFGNASAEIDGSGMVQLGGNPAFKDPLKQARASAAMVSAELKRWMHREMWVNPVVVLPGWRIAPPKVETDVVLLNEETIPEFFKTRPEKLNTSEIRDICSHLDRSARS